MSTSTTIHFGCYLVCTMTKTPLVVSTAVCSHDDDHCIPDYAKFCPVCGASIIVQTAEVLADGAMVDLFNDVTSRPIVDLLFLNNTFLPMIGDIGFDQPGCEVILYNHGSESVDGDEAGIHELGRACLVDQARRPTQEEIDRLMSIVGYTNVEVKFGVIVEIG